MEVDKKLEVFNKLIGQSSDVNMSDDANKTKKMLLEAIKQNGKGQKTGKPRGTRGSAAKAKGRGKDWTERRKNGRKLK
jgi:hypothetical protein